MFATLLLTALLLPQEHVTSVAEFTEGPVVAGAPAELRVRLDVDPGWHVYHPDQDPNYGIPVSVSVSGAGLTAGALRTLDAPKVHQELIGSETLVYLWLEGAPEFRVPVSFADAGSYTVEVQVDWQVCDDSVCLPPASETHVVTVEVAPPAAPAAQQYAAENVDVEVELDRASVSSGGEVVVRARLTMAPGWHVYHPDQDPNYGIPVSLSVTGADLVPGALRALEGPQVHQEMIGSEALTYLWLGGEATLELPVKVGGAPGARELAVRVGWQTCDDSVCLPPDEHVFTVALEVSGEAVAVEAGAQGGAQSGGVPPAEDEKPLAELLGQVQPELVGASGELADGGEMDLVFQLNVAPDWHVYHPDQDPDYGIPVSVEVLGEGLEALGAVRALDEPESHLEAIGSETLEYLWLTGTPRFVQRVKISGDPESILARAVIRWQACDDSVCVDAEAYGFALDRVQLNSLLLREGEVKGLLGEGFWAFLLAAAAAGFATLFTPCVFPMIPITISFFTKRAEQGKGSALGNAAAYGGGIVLTFVGLGLGAAALLGASGANDIASNPWLNLALAALFLFFAFSLLGFYEINAPRWMQNMASKTQAEGQNKVGYMPVVLMAVAFSVTAFTCTVGFVGGVLALGASSGSWIYPLAGMTVYALVFAFPFFLLAMFPTMMKGLPQAGGWMNAVKVTLGYVEMIAAWKFLSNADRSWNWEFLTRPVVITLTAIPLALSAAYLFGWYRTHHDFEKPRPGKARILTGLLFVAMTVFVVDGYRRDAYAGGVEGFFPPLAYGVHNVDDEGREIGPAKLGWYDNYPEAFEAALENDRLLFLDFTGITCVNCLRMEGNIFPQEEVRSRLAQLERAHLWVDKAPHGTFNKALQFEEFNSQQQPQYVLIDPRDNIVLGIFNGYKPDPALFASFLQDGIDAYAGRTPGVARPRFTLRESADGPDVRLPEGN